MEELPALPADSCIWGMLRGISVALREKGNARLQSSSYCHVETEENWLGVEVTGLYHPRRSRSQITCRSELFKAAELNRILTYSPLYAPFVRVDHLK